MMKPEGINDRGDNRQVEKFLANTLVLIGLAVLTSACAPRQFVYLPGDWSSPPPQAERVAPPMEGKKMTGTPPAPRASAEMGKPIFEPPASIRETELTPVQEAPAAPVKEVTAPPTPQHYASMHLVDQARSSMAGGNFDEAISMYEQAVQVDVYNGEAFLGLAKAWHMKGSGRKALEFAKKGEILLQDKPSRLKEVYLLQADIYKQLGDAGQAQVFLQKASRL